MMGSGGMIVMDERTCMVDVARYFLMFLLEESCGKCVPCREGLRQLLTIYDRILDGKGEPGDLDTIERLSRGMQVASLCELGKSAPNPVLSTIRYFREEYEAHIEGDRCPAGICPTLTRFFIDEDACDGCHACFAVCPTMGITPERENRVAFTRPYYRTQIAIVVRAGAGEPAGFADLVGKRIAAGNGTTSERAVLRHLADSIAAFENKGELPTAERLTSGEVDAAVMDGPAADALVAASEGRLVRLPGHLETESYALALPKGRDVLLAELDVILERLDRTGRLRLLNERHGL